MKNSINYHNTCSLTCIGFSLLPSACTPRVNCESKNLLTADCKIKKYEHSYDSFGDLKLFREAEMFNSKKTRTTYLHIPTRLL